MQLNKETHTYEDKEKNKYTSVSRILNSLEPPFDPHGFITKRVAIRDKISIEEVQNNWKALADASLKKGTLVHDILSNYIIDRKRPVKFKTLITHFKDLKIPGKLLSEQILFNKENLIAGTADLIADYKKFLHLYDFKTSKNIDFFSKYGETMLKPMSHLSHCNYNRYALQLSFYAWMLEQRGERIGKLGIIKISDDGMEMIPCNYMKFEVEKILSSEINIKEL